ncbi:putative phiE125 gp8 family phage protein [Tepidamorphus gemmatus]|uniref:Putative phiE125 gp8 family phage protein n=1 Tax=Tepidamorphus gemmatus TaxID=747076 RepID=A0A4R3MG02_9HYPH|nr:head-tail connector protein [Tepidamorphus gemmatus]TCT12665.1 putative phiE125 gp8 family phage protein [Tepidamorphus gemmatus]
MSAITVHDLKAHLNITHSGDDDLLAGKIAAASAWIDRFLEVPLADYPVAEPPEMTPEEAEAFDFEAFDPYAGVPAPIKEAVRQLAAHLYENREASLVGITAEAVPFGLFDLIGPYRAWSF